MRDLTVDELKVVSEDLNATLAKHGVRMTVETKIVLLKEDESDKPEGDIQVAEENGKGETPKTEETTNA